MHQVESMRKHSLMEQTRNKVATGGFGCRWAEATVNQAARCLSKLLLGCTQPAVASTYSRQKPIHAEFGVMERCSVCQLGGVDDCAINVEWEARSKAKNRKIGWALLFLWYPAPYNPCIYSCPAVIILRRTASCHENEWSCHLIIKSYITVNRGIALITF